MARLPVISGDDFVKAVARIGFVWDRTEGSHMILVGPGGQMLSGAQAQGIGQRPAESADPRCRPHEERVHGSGQIRRHQFWVERDTPVSVER